MDETALLEAISRLDESALTAVFEQYAPMVFRYALHLCGDPEEADDIVGDVFSRLLSHLSNGRGPRSNLRSYLYQTAYHILIDHTRDRKRYTLLDDSPVQIDTASLPPEEAEQHRQFTLLKNAIQTTLTEDQKHVIVLRFLEGFDVRETARILGKEVNNVKVIQNRAVAKLREVLKDEIEELE